MPVVRTSPRGRLRSAVVCGSLLATTVLGVPLAGPAGARAYAAGPGGSGSGAAGPGDDGAGAAQQTGDLTQLLPRLRTLYGQVASAAAAYGRAKQVADDRRAKAEAVDRQLAEQKVRVAAGREQAGLMARQMYRDGGLSPYLALLTGESPQDFFGRKHLLDRAADHQKDVLAGLAGGRARLAALNTQAQHALDSAQHAQRVQAAKQAELQSALHQIVGLLAGLTPDQAGRIAGAQAPAAAADGGRSTPSR